MEWTPEQDRALKAVDRWLSKGDAQVFRLFGYAGAGKTTLARHFAEHVGGEVAFAAFTGKAAHVMRAKGCVGATTIHSLIYRPDTDDDGAEAPSFTLRRDAPASKADLIVIDECSMVDEELGRDLLSFGAPVLVLGDPAQLPPVKGGGFFTDADPDFMLTEIHRQAADNPIIRLSMNIREGGEAFDDGLIDGDAARGCFPPRHLRRRHPVGRPSLGRHQQDAEALQRPDTRPERTYRSDAGSDGETRLPSKQQTKRSPKRRHLDRYAQESGARGQGSDDGRAGRRRKARLYLGAPPNVHGRRGKRALSRASRRRRVRLRLRSHCA